MFDKSGITSAAAAVSFTALAPGAVISIYGSRLAENTAQAQTLPLPPQLADTQVFVAGTTAGGGSTGLLNLPLYYVSQNQVNALVPYEVSVDTSLQLLVQRGTTYSVPVQIDMAKAQPAVFSSGGVPGSAGLIQVYPVMGGQPYFASPSAPAHAGDTIVLYCTGLGAVNPGVTDGAAPQTNPCPARQAPHSCGRRTIGSRELRGPSSGFAGLVPSECGGTLRHANGRDRVRNTGHRWADQPANYDADRVNPAASPAFCSSARFRKLYDLFDLLHSLEHIRD